MSTSVVFKSMDKRGLVQFEVDGQTVERTVPVVDNQSEQDKLIKELAEGLLIEYKTDSELPAITSYKDGDIIASKSDG